MPCEIAALANFLDIRLTTYIGEQSIRQRHYFVDTLAPQIAGVAALETTTGLIDFGRWTISR